MRQIISQQTIDRLPIYYRTLKWIEAQGFTIVSSQELGKVLGLTPEQIRKDLSSFGQFGKKGIGYFVADLKNKIANILGRDCHWRMAIVGYSYMCAAIITYKNLSELGFTVEAIFDEDEKNFGKELCGVKVYDFKKIDSVIQRKLIDVGVVAVPEYDAQKVTNALVSAGVHAIWNFAPIKLNVPEKITVVNEDFSIGLSTLSYNLAQL